MSTTPSKEARHGESATIAQEHMEEFCAKHGVNLGEFFRQDLRRAFQSAIDKATKEIKAEADLWKQQSEFESKHREKYRQRLIALAKKVPKSSKKTCPKPDNEAIR
jgi:hypothetical protein